jgi:nucleoside-diphosphate-sugar epimerase
MFASSREVYGNSEKIKHHEDEAYVKNCESPYTASKIAGEALVHSYHECYGIGFVILRFSNVYGMYDESDRVIPLFIKNAKEGNDIIVFGKDKLLDFTYIDDTVTGIIRCIEEFDNIQDNVFNIAYGEGVSIMEVATMIRDKINQNVNVIIEENRTGEVVRYIADITKAKQILDYNPKIDIIEGVSRSIDWYSKELYK